MTPAGTVERYLAAVARHDWETLNDCVSEDVVRIGPYGDTYRGREEYVAFLSSLMPTLAGYRMDVDRVVYTPDGKTAAAELSETVSLDGVVTVTAEGLVFDLDDAGRIHHVAIYIRTPSPATPKTEGGTPSDH